MIWSGALSDSARPGTDSTRLLRKKKLFGVRRLVAALVLFWELTLKMWGLQQRK